MSVSAKACRSTWQVASLRSVPASSIYQGLKSDGDECQKPLKEGTYRIFAIVSLCALALAIVVQNYLHDYTAEADKAEP
jgi:hypothetical protein